MNTFTIALASVVAAAALGVGLANGMAAPATEVVKLERVVIVAKRTDNAVVAKLPRVVVEYHRAVPLEVTMAAAQAATWIA